MNNLNYNDLTVVILTYNESIHIARALSSVAPLRCNVIVLDSYSTDETCEIATSAGATVIQRSFINQSDQFNWLLDQDILKTAWVMRLDADEHLSGTLPDQISNALTNAPCSTGGFSIKRKHVFMGTWLKHGGRYPLELVRIWRREVGRLETKWMDEHVILTSGAIDTIDDYFTDENLNGITYFTEKHNAYATREAVDFIIRRRDGTDSEASQNKKLHIGRQAAVKRRFKQEIYERLPFFIAPALYFLYRYLFLLGFMDGRAGLTYHVMQGFWYRFLVSLKISEYELAIQPENSVSIDAVLRKLSQISGLRLSRHGRVNSDPN